MRRPVGNRKRTVNDRFLPEGRYILWRGDRKAREEETSANNRFFRVFEELEAAGIAAEPCMRSAPSTSTSPTPSRHRAASGSTRRAGSAMPRACQAGPGARRSPPTEKILLSDFGRYRGRQPAPYRSSIGHRSRRHP
jgi:hypothetical protein